jgi:hypothetical protein
VAAVGTTSRATSARSKLRDFPWLSPIQTLQHKQDLTGLTPKRGLVAAQPIERIGWQVGQPNKGVGEIVGLISKRVGRWWSINASGAVILIRPKIVSACVGGPVQLIDDCLAVSMCLSPSPELKEMLGLDPEQPALNGELRAATATTGSPV